jgi:hypothetical protein
MANPYGNIAGVSDQEVPGWQQRVVDGVREAERSRSRAKIGIRRGRIDSQVDERYAVLLRYAAEKRDMNVAAYVRRAVAAFIAVDLDISFEDVVRYGPQPTGYAMPHKPGVATEDDGEGYGSWEVKG